MSIRPAPSALFPQLPRLGLAAAFLIAFPGYAQLNLNVPLVLDGGDPQVRQVTGLSDPTDHGDAVSLGAARASVVNTVVVVGTDQLAGDLTPAPTGYSIGMVVTLISSSPNAEGATLDLNGLGPIPIVRAGGVPLGQGMFQPGIPARLTFDGSRFQVISGTGLPCMTGYSVASDRYCIADQPLPAATFFDAITTCADQGSRLCTISEWSHACRSIPGFFATVTEAEWVDHAANNNTGAKLVGFGIDGGEGGLGSGCEYGGQVVPTTPYRFRCCSNR
jgi:hypothetical protein